MTEKEHFLALADASIKQVDLHKQIAIASEVDELIISLHEKVLTHFTTLRDLVSANELSVNYTNQFTNDINQTKQSYRA